LLKNNMLLSCLSKVEASLFKIKIKAVFSQAAFLGYRFYALASA